MAIDVQHAVADDEAQLNTDINTTPLVDVMLVMLIIFLVTIPVIVKSIPVQLPTYRNIVTQTKPENIVIAVTTDEQMFYNNEPVDPATMERNFVDALRRAIEPGVVHDDIGVRERRRGRAEQPLQLREPGRVGIVGVGAEGRGRLRDGRVLLELDALDIGIRIQVLAERLDQRDETVHDGRIVDRRRIHAG